MNITPWIGCDLDATLAGYTSWEGNTRIGPPIPKMKERILKHLQDGDEVRIVTARVSIPEGLPATDRLVREQEVRDARQAIRGWLLIHFGRDFAPKIKVTCQKDFGMKFCYDDRCKQVIPNTGELVEEKLETLVAKLIVAARQGDLSACKMLLLEPFK